MRIKTKPVNPWEPEYSPGVSPGGQTDGRRLLHGPRGRGKRRKEKCLGALPRIRSQERAERRLQPAAWSLTALPRPPTSPALLNRQEAFLAWMVLLSELRVVKRKTPGRAARGAEERYLGLVTTANERVLLACAGGTLLYVGLQIVALGFSQCFDFLTQCSSA